MVATFMVRRVANHAALAVLAASLGYLLAAAALDPRAGLEDRAPRPPQAVIEARLVALNLDDRTPLAERYLTWARGVAQGDFGRTWDGEPVEGELWRRLGVSFRLVAPGAVLGGALGVALGAYAAARHGRAADRLVSGGSYLLLAVPVFVLAPLLQIMAGEANDALGMRVFVWLGESAPGPSGGRLWDLADRARRLILPTATIALCQIALYARYQRGLMLDVLHADHVRAARARGLRRRGALLRHGLRTAIVPMTAYFAYTSGLVLLGGVFTETAFGRHGLGEWLVDSISRGDVNAVAAVECLAACAVLLAALASDVLAAALDPRVRAGAAP